MHVFFKRNYMAGILVTGAGGFIGSHIVEEALRRGYDIYAGVRRTTSREYLSDPRIKFVELDFTNTERLCAQLLQYKKEMGGWDYIVHNLGVTKCKRQKDFYTINHEYTRNFTNALIECLPTLLSPTPTTERANFKPKSTFALCPTFLTSYCVLPECMALAKETIY